MLPAAPNIVITLKNRQGGSYLSGRSSHRENRDSRQGGAPVEDMPHSPPRRSRSPAARNMPEGPGASRSRTRSPESPAALRSPGSPRASSQAKEKSPTDSAQPTALNRAGLEDIFGQFHGEFEAWMKAEESKIEHADVRSSAARRSLVSCGNSVCDFIRDYAPETYAKLGPDPAVEGFNSHSLPQFLDVVDEDRRALQEATAALGAFAERRFPRNDELTALKAESPVALLKGILRLISPKQDVGEHSSGRRRHSGRSRGGAREAPPPAGDVCSRSPSYDR